MKLVDFKAISGKGLLKPVLVFVILVQLLLSFQGFDVCEDGFALTFYQQFFNDPSSVEYNFVYWLSGLVGGLWYEIYPKGGVLWFKILAIIINTSTFALSYHILKPYIKPIYLLISLMMVLFLNDFGFLVFYNNHLTAFLAVLSVFFLHRGLTNKSLMFIALSAFIVGLNVFTRLPNLSQLALVICIPFWGYYKSVPFWEVTKQVLAFLGMFILGLCFVFFLLAILGQVDIMESALNSVFNLGVANDSGHNISTLFKAYVYNYIKLSKYIIGLIGYIGLIFLISNALKKLTLVQYALKFISLILFMIWISKAGIHGIYGIGYIGIFSIILLNKCNKELKILALMAFVLQFLLPFGSGGGLRSIGYMSIWLSFPLILLVIDTIKQVIPNFRYAFTQKENWLRDVRYLSILFFVAFILVKTHNISQNAYFDIGPRWDKTYAINNDLANYVYTTKRRANIINEALINLKRFVKPNDYLLAYDKIPMFHFYKP